jgi:hypothetical protein
MERTARCVVADRHDRDDGIDDVVLAAKGGQVFKLAGRDASLPVPELIFTGGGAYSTSGVFIGIDDLALARWYSGDWVRLTKTGPGWIQSRVSVPTGAPAGQKVTTRGLLDPVTGRKTVVLRHGPGLRNLRAPLRLPARTTVDLRSSTAPRAAVGSWSPTWTGMAGRRPAGGGAWFRNPGDVFTTWTSTATPGRSP